MESRPNKHSWRTFRKGDVMHDSVKVTQRGIDGIDETRLSPFLKLFRSCPLFEAEYPTNMYIQQRELDRIARETSIEECVHLSDAATRLDAANMFKSGEERDGDVFHDVGLNECSVGN